MSVAKTILRQIQAQDPHALMAWGANRFIGTKNGVSFHIRTPKYKKGVHVKITLNDYDTYDIEVIRISGVTREVIDTQNGVFCDMLIDSLDSLIDEKEIVLF
ncbi:hypothetical protein [Cytobacillus oceanisediminis]|uniref:hypothetical protein n=1 Tax=Cytobacillus oceanisediminis TaxID=665099 RepID=UPI002041E5DD|nr:hypothetical protein [Cytobacillus oceanisediminis]MCM3405495.1 hypothetical protein [Cytobacillus oceanisediminis]